MSERAQRASHANGAGPGVPARERAGGSGPPSPFGFGEVSPEPAVARVLAEAEGAKPPGEKG